jgi:hypothetical protein
MESSLNIKNIRQERPNSFFGLPKQAKLKAPLNLLPKLNRGTADKELH